MIRKEDYFSIFLALLAVILTFLMVLYPEATFKGANYGLKTWATVLIPALLPFFIIADVLVELGIVTSLGILLEPLMRPLFKQPGAAGFVMAMGFTSGFPMGAVLTNTLYEKNLCSKEEAGRLIAFTNNSSPLFLLVAVPIGMFQNPKLGILFALAHYGANIILGVCLGLTASQAKFFNFEKDPGPNIFKKSFRELILTRRRNNLPLGKIIGNAVNKSIQNMLMIGGFVIFFAVLIEIFRVTNIFFVLTAFFNKVLYLIGINSSLGEALTTGLFEMTLGTKKTTEVTAPLLDQVIIASFILGWSGFSIQAQVTSIAAKNKISVTKYLLGRFIQGFLAAIITLFLFSFFTHSSPVINLDLGFDILVDNNYFIFNIIFIFLITLILLILSGLFYIIKKIKQAF